MATRNDDPLYLSTAIDSIIAQTYKNWELIIIDDSSNPSTLELLGSVKERLGKARCRVVHNDVPLGLPRSLNAGLALASGDYIARMDGDDVCMPDRFEAQVDFLGRHPEIGILGGDIEIVSHDLRTLSIRSYTKDPKKLVVLGLIRNPLAHPTVMMRKTVVDEIGGYDPRCKKAEDHDLWLRAIKRSVGIANLGKVVIKYRVPEAHLKKHDKRDWNYSIYVKIRNFNFRHPFYSLVGVFVGIAFRLAPPSLVERLYRRDHQSPMLYRESGH